MGSIREGWGVNQPKTKSSRLVYPPYPISLLPAPRSELPTLFDLSRVNFRDTLWYSKFKECDLVRGRP